ncbi:MAG: hypothetical protein ACOX69_08575 [Coriobacteriales bacterium]|jgi:hypothetical protein
MADLKIKVIIDGVEFTEWQLDRYEYERTLHCLHEFKYLGADVVYEGRSLSHEDINWLEPADAKKALVDLKVGLGPDKVNQIMKPVSDDAELRWKAYNEEPIASQGYQFGTTEMEVSGIDMTKVAGGLGHLGDKDERFPFEIFPEHYGVEGEVETGQAIFEAFGMFGEPVHTYGVGSTKEIPADFPFKRDPNYPGVMFGELGLKSDGTNIHVGAIHEICPVPGGVKTKSTFFCPKNAPAAIPEGHKLHFALEMRGNFRSIYEAQQ